MVRITEHNDWVIYCILGSIFAYIILLSVFNRDANVKDFLIQKVEDANNLIPSWILVSFIRCVTLSLLLSHFVPIVPGFISKNIQVYGFEMNKFGFTLMALIICEIIKNIFTFLFYSSVGSVKNLKGLSLAASKFYFLETITYIISAFTLYYFPIDLIKFFYFVIALFGGSFILKILIYIFNNQSILPEKWYYKFLYICTLQIVPVLVLWKFLFY